MRSTNLVLGVFLFFFAACPAWADSSITGTASTISCGIVNVKGSITLDTECKIVSTKVTVSVFKDGCAVTTFTVPVSGTSFIGHSLPGFSSGTYTVTLGVDITDACSNTATYETASTLVIP